MKKLAITSKVSKTIGKASLQLKKHSPEILIVVGVIGTVTSAVMACKATTKAGKIVDEAKNEIDKIHEATEKGVTTYGETYFPEDSKKDLTLVYFQTGIKFVKLYAPSVILGTLSLSSIVASNNILRKRNVALMAAYTAVDKSFKEYRGRVVERFGKEVDKELKYNIKAKEVEETVVDENGNETTVKKTVNSADPNAKSEYAILFDKNCSGWDNTPEYLEFFLNSQQNWANDRLRGKGHLLLNEIYDELGVERTAAGCVVGWIYKPDDNNEEGDNYVEFDVEPVYDDNGNKTAMIIDFNVDGVIYDKI